MTLEQKSLPLLPKRREIPGLTDYSHLPEDIPTLRKIYQYMAGDGTNPDEALLRNEISRSGGDEVGAWMYLVSRQILARNLI